MTVCTRRNWPTIAVALALSAGCTTAAQDAQPQNDAANAAFLAGVEEYVTMRSRLEEPLPPFSATRSTLSNLVAKRYLASAIRAARRSSRPGTIFTPAVAAAFRERINEALTVAERQLLGRGEAAEPYAPVPRVNEPVEAVFLAAAPTPLLARLPELPAAIEYRFVGNDLILWDADADIVVDVLTDALR